MLGMILANRSSAKRKKESYEDLFGSEEECSPSHKRLHRRNNNSGDERDPSEDVSHHSFADKMSTERLTGYRNLTKRI